MAKQWQIRRGTTAENDDFTGAIGELTMDTDTKGVRVHDGSTQGGFQIDTVIAFQKPTADNDYTWYRLYSSGWVEQGGRGYKNNTANQQQTFSMPLEMSNIYYSVMAHMADDNESGYVFEVQIKNQTTTGFDVRIIASYQDATWVTDKYFVWEVKGMAA